MLRRTFHTLIAAAMTGVFAVPHVLVAASPAVVAPSEKLSPEQERLTFKVPPGFEVQLVAAEQDIHKPMNMTFDAAGRLWVTDTVDYPFPVTDGPGHDTVKILSDFGADGRAKTITTFVTGLTLPLGVMPLDDGKTQSAIVYGTPEIRLHTDTDGDGVADKTEKLIGTVATSDTHGMTNNFTRGFDGWIYANHGFKNESTLVAKDGSTIHMGSGNTYRFQKDGTKLQIFAHGQVNPFGLCFDRMGNLFSADCHTRPQMLLIRGGYYPSFGRPDDGLGFAPEMCRHDHGSTAIAGTMVYDAAQFPKEFRGNLFDGNPVTNAVNRDRIDWTGSTPTAVEQPDFMTSTDLWFRPVQVTLGPDGAIYVADFYNKIIGHYEVDLKHPGRDRTSGRIWRIVYKGDNPTPPSPTMPNLKTMTAEQVVAALGDENITVRLLATNWIVDRKMTDAVPLLKKAITEPKGVEQAAHAAWALERQDALTPELQATLATSPQASCRAHAARILSERQNWSSVDCGVADKLLSDADATVRRAAADAIARHPDATWIDALLAAGKKAPAADTHLNHAIRIALRDQFVNAEILGSATDRKLSPADKLAILDAALGVQSQQAGAFAAQAAAERDLPRDLAIRALKHAVKLAADEQAIAHIADAAAKKFADDIDLQLELLKSVREGLASRGGATPPAVRDWASSAATAVLTAEPRKNDEALAWSSKSVEGMPMSLDPWTPQLRKCSDGKQADFFSSLPKGETLTGILRSKPFAAPAKLSVWLAGHNGFPTSKDPEKNIVRVRLVATDEIIAQAAPPRNDVAKKTTLDLSAAEGKQVYFEAVDADTRTAYAWLAFGRFEPAVVPIPKSGADLRKRIEAAVDLAGTFQLKHLAEPIVKLLSTKQSDPTVRASAAKALASLDPVASVQPLVEVVSDADSPAALRDTCAAALGTVKDLSAYPAMVTALRAAPQRVQRALALALSGSHDGGEVLLGAVGAGKASPRLLTDKVVRDRLKAASIDKLDERLVTLTKGVPDVDETVQKLIDQRRGLLASASARYAADRGQAVFAKNCAVCHRIGNDGATIGPQLDGVGKRGMDRLLEDILDPSRNVDGAFRYSIITLDDGDVVTGLQRRVDGESIVFADAQGKEFTIAKAKIKKRVESQLSLMPSNFGEIVPEKEFGDLVTYLLTK